MKNKSDIRVLGWPAFLLTTNPYNRILYSAIRKLDVDVIDFSLQNILFGSYNIVHVHWPEGYLSRKNSVEAFGKTLLVLIFLGLARLRRAKVIWTAHNLIPHDEYHPLLTRYFWKIFPGFLDGFICLSKSSYKLIIETHPNLKSIKSFSHVFGIGPYKIYPNEIDQGQARHLLNLPQNAFIILFIGNISPYKNVPALARCFQNLQGDDYYLLIAGEPSSEYLAKELQTLANQDNRIHLNLEFIPDDKLQIFLNAADLVVFPFTNMLNSSSGLLALSFNRPVLFPHTGSSADLQKLFGRKWVQTYEDDFSSMQLMQAINAVKSTQYQKVNLDLSILNWDKIASDTVSFYKDLLDG